MAARVIVMAGGTGGHVFPALAVAETLRDRGCEVSWLGTNKGLEARVVPAAEFNLDAISVSGIRGTSLYRRLLAPFVLATACVQAVRVFRKRRPQVVLGMGGFVSGPGGLVARLLGIRLVIHEQNRIPGTTNRWLARFADQVLEAFPGTFPHKVGAICTGNPLRRSFTRRFERQTRHGDALRLLVVGGSQGARFLNETVPIALAAMPKRLRVDVWHQTGSALFEATDARYRELGIPARVDPFIEDMAEAYLWADVAVCRAGAMTVSELAAAGLPAIFVPFPHAIDDHQTANARFVTEQGGALCIAQGELDAERLASELTRFCEDRSELDLMGQRIHRLARLDAADRVATLCQQEVT